MVQVPSPTVSPSFSGVGGVSPRVIDDAFGAGVVAADKQLGRQLESSGDEIFKTAMGIQAQLNDAAAKEADAQYVMRSSELYANYQSLQGDAAVKARPKFIEDLSKLREEVRTGLGNPVAQRMFDASTRQQFARTVFSTAAHAAQEARRYADRADDAQIRSATFSTEIQPDNFGQAQDNLARAEAAVRAQGKRNGLPPEAIEQNVKEARSGFLANQIRSLSNKDPNMAFDMYEAQEKNLSDKDKKQVQAVVVNGRRQWRANDITQQTMFGLDPDDPKKTLQEIQDEAIEAGAKYYKGDPELKDAIKRSVQIEWNNLRRTKTETQRALNNEFEAALGGFKSNGERPTTMQQLLALPGMADAWQKLQVADPKRARAYEKAVELNAKAALVQSDEEERRRLLTLSEDDPTAFLAESPMANEKLSPRSREQFYKLQLQKEKEPDKNPKVQAAMGVLTPMLRDAGVTRDRPKVWDQYKGALMDAMADYQTEHKKPMPFEEIQKTGARLLQDMSPKLADRFDTTTSKPFFPWTKQPLYNIPVPKEMEKKLQQLRYEKSGIMPTPDIVQRDYVRMLLNRDAKAKAKAEQK